MAKIAQNGGVLTQTNCLLSKPIPYKRLFQPVLAKCWGKLVGRKKPKTPVFRAKSIKNGLFQGKNGGKKAKKWQNQQIGVIFCKMAFFCPILGKIAQFQAFPHYSLKTQHNFTIFHIIKRSETQITKFALLNSIL